MLTVDLHLHTDFSDGKLPLHKLVDICGEAGLDAIAVTDHVCTMGHLLGLSARVLKFTLTERHWRAYTSALEKERNRAWRQYKMIVFTGAEYSRNTFSNRRNAHLLAIDCDRWIPPELDEDEWLKAARREGALTVAAHPMKLPDAKSQTYYLLENHKKFMPLIDVWEVANARTFWRGMTRYPFSLIASSDMHSAKRWPSWRTRIPCDKDPEAIKAHFKDIFNPREFAFVYGRVNEVKNVISYVPRTKGAHDVTDDNRRFLDDFGAGGDPAGLPVAVSAY